MRRAPDPRTLVTCGGHAHPQPATLGGAHRGEAGHTQGVPSCAMIQPNERHRHPREGGLCMLIGRPSSGPSESISLAHPTHRPHTSRQAAHLRATQMQMQTDRRGSAAAPQTSPYNPLTGRRFNQHSMFNFNYIDFNYIIALRHGPTWDYNTSD